MPSNMLKIALVLAITCQISWCQIDLPDCLDPTACDGSAASCTIGVGCLGSPITMCSLGNFSYNAACETFPGTTQQYCKCDSCVGLLNALLWYDCTCGGNEYTCDEGFTLHTCKSTLAALGGKTQYVCCLNGC